MLGDVLLIDQNHHQAAEQILELITADPPSKMTLAIGGESGSGKTEIAHLVARGLKAKGTPAKVLHIDNYYQVPPTQRAAWRKENGPESIGYTEYDWPLINRNIQEFREDQAHAVMPCIDLLTDQIDELHTSFLGFQYLIIEGLYAVKAEVDLRFLLDLTYHETKEAQEERGKEPLNSFRWQVLEREHQVVQSLRPDVDYFISDEFQLYRNENQSRG